jgi:hypothetical protein
MSITKEVINTFSMVEICQVCGKPKSECGSDYNDDFNMCGSCYRTIWRTLNKKKLEESNSSKPDKRGLLRG